MPLFKNYDVVLKTIYTALSSLALFNKSKPPSKLRPHCGFDIMFTYLRMDPIQKPY